MTYKPSSISEIYANPNHGGHPTTTITAGQTNLRQGISIINWFAGENSSHITQITSGDGTAVVITTTDTGGVVDGTTVTDGGSGYVVGQVLSIDGGNGDCRVVVTSAPAGSISTLAILDGGTGFTGAAGQTATTLIGFLINSSGIYDLDWVFHFGASVPSEIHGTFTVADASTNTNITKVNAHRDIGAEGVTGSSGCSGYIDVSPGDFLYPETYSDTATTIAWEHSNITIKRVN